MKPNLTKKILIADDDPTLLLLLKFRFEESGYKVFTAVNGKDAIEQAFFEKPDIIISDILMPVHTGIEVVESIKATYENLPIILLSNAGQEEIVNKAFSVGANDFLNKPFTVDDLQVKVNNLLFEKPVLLN